MFSLFRKELRHVKLLKRYRKFNTQVIHTESYCHCQAFKNYLLGFFFEAFCNLTAHTFQSQRHSRLLTEFGTHGVACLLFSSRVDTCKCWKWHWYVCFPVKCKERVKCRSGESFQLCLLFFLTLEWKNTPVCVRVETLTAWFICFYDCSSRALKRPQGTYMLMHIHTLKHNTATLNFLTNHRADGSASLCLASYKQKRQRAVFASHSSSVSRTHTDTNTSPRWIAGAIKRQQRLTCPWKPNRQPKAHINICTSAVATMSKRSLYYMLQRLCLGVTAVSCGGGRCKVPVCLPKWPLTCKPHTEMYTQCLVCFPKSCSSRHKLHCL